MAKDKEITAQLQRTVKDSLIYLPARIIPAIIGILLIRVLSTLFSHEDYGYYQITLSTFGLIRVFSMIWLSTSVTRFYLRYREEGNEATFHTTLFYCTLGGALIISLISFMINQFFFAPKLADELFSLINLAIAASIFNTIFEVYVVIYRAGLQPKKYTFYWVLFSIGKPLVGVLLVYVWDFRADGIFWGFLTIPLILDVVIFYKLRVFSYLKIRDFSTGLLKKFMKYGIPISFSFLAFWVLSLSDRYLIGYFQGSSEVGLYSVGYTIAEKTLNFVYMILMLAAFPIIIQNYEQHGDERAQKLISELTRYFMLICIPIFMVLVALPREVFLLFSDVKFVDGAIVLPFIAFAMFLNGLNQYVLKGFELHQKSIRIAQLALLAGVVDVLLNIFLIPRYGYMGAGIAACIAYLSYFSLSVYFSRFELAWKPSLKSMARILTVAGISVFILKSLNAFFDNIFLTFLVVIPAGLLFFYATLIFIREIDWHEVSAGINFIKKRFGLSAK